MDEFPCCVYNQLLGNGRLNNKYRKARSMQRMLLAVTLANRRGLLIIVLEQVSNGQLRDRSMQPYNKDIIMLEYEANENI